MAGRGEFSRLAHLPDKAVSLIYSDYVRRFMAAKTLPARRRYMIVMSKARSELDRRGLPVECI